MQNNGSTGRKRKEYRDGEPRKVTRVAKDISRIDDRVKKTCLKVVRGAGSSPKWPGLGVSTMHPPVDWTII